MRRLSWPVTLPLAVFLIALAVANRSAVGVNLWPLPFVVELPLFLLPYGGVVLGVVIGATVLGLRVMVWRRRAHRAELRLGVIEREVLHRRQAGISSTAPEFAVRSGWPATVGE